MKMKHLLETTFAHSSLDGLPQLLSEHLVSTAKLAEEFGTPIGMKTEARFAGLWHDIGKASPEFQDKLKCSSRRLVDHKGAGTLLACEEGHPEIAFAVFGHHGGLPSLSDLKSKATSRMPGSLRRDEKISIILNELRANPPEEFLSKSPSTYEPPTPTSLDLRIRMLFSCLVDADWLDTEAHFSPDKSQQRQPFPELSVLAESFFSNQEKFQKTAPPTGLNDLRRRLYDEALVSAERQPGIFRMTIPTGGGKTRTALGFAFTHAQKYNHRRIITVMPYTSIIDQTAEEYEKIFREKAFLVHHSGYSSTDNEGQNKLASENWDANLILTTTVQLFDSLFSNKPGDCRKLHRIAGSVIILDEAQTLPVKLLKPICDMLIELVRSYGVTIVLSSATQPALDRVNTEGWDKVFRGEIIADPEPVYRKLKRVSYSFDECSWSMERTANSLMNHQQGMVVLNTKSQALELYKLVFELDSSAIYLTSLLCPEHRRNVIKDIKHRLRKGEACRLITTQIVEAGVDIDFPVVFRAAGPLDRVVQAAGRCNREGKLKEGKCFVFIPEDGKCPMGEYKHGLGQFIATVRAGKFDPDNPATFDDYFSRLFKDRDLDSLRINALRSHNTLDFPEVSERFHLIDDGNTVAVAVGYNPDNNCREYSWENSPANKLISSWVKDRKFSLRELYRRLAPYFVNVYQKKLPEFLRHGPVIMDKQTGVYCWKNGSYNNVTGVALGEFSIDNSVI